MISVVIPLFNKEASIYCTLESVLEQSYSDYEIVIVNDGSTDQSVEEVILFCSDHCNSMLELTEGVYCVDSQLAYSVRLRLVEQENQGVSAARNKGIECSEGTYIAFLDADDRWMPSYLQTQYNLTLKYPECNVFATAYEFEDYSGKRSQLIMKKMPFDGEDGVLSNYFEVGSSSHPPICSISVIIIKSALLEIGGFPVGVKSGEDLLTWAKLAVKNKIAYSTKKCATYYFDMDSFNNNIREPEKYDIVGEELLLLIKDNPTLNIESYYARWKKIRASIFFRYRNRQLDAFKELKEALRVNFRNTDLWKMLILFCVPYPIRKKIFAR